MTTRVEPVPAVLCYSGRNSRHRVAHVEQHSSGVYNYFVVQEGQIRAPLRVLLPHVQQTFLEDAGSRRTQAKQGYMFALWQ